MTVLAEFKRHFVKDEDTLDSWEQIDPYVEMLKNRDINEKKMFDKWLADFSELISIVYEIGTSREVAMTCDTEDEEIKESYNDYIDNIEPPFKEAIFGLYQKMLSAKVFPDVMKEMPLLAQMVKNEVELFSEKNIPLETQESKLCQNYQEITGAWMVSFKGQEYTMPEMMVFLEDNEATVRQAAFEAITKRRSQDKVTLNDLYNELLKTRQEIATNLSLSDYRTYLFKLNRREYTPDDCFLFHESVFNKIVPLVTELRQQKAKKLGQTSLNPWDTSCDPDKKAPLRPFQEVEDLKDGVEKIFGLINPKLKDYFASIRYRQDLGSRRGKAPGGYQATFDEVRLPFIFMNAAGSQEDVETLLHEAGHSFHCLEYRNQPYYWYRGAPMEFCEVSSMSFELIGGEHFGVFYKDSQQAKKARLKHLTGVLELFPWVMTVDAFQHWIYTHPNHSVAERENQWKSLHQKFDGGVNWAVMPDEIQKNWWHKQLHIFLDPFYYIEYAISQLGALQIYRNYKKNKEKCLKDFLNAMSLGASQSCRDIYSAAGIEFRFDAAIVGELAQMVYDEILVLEKECA